LRGRGRPGERRYRRRTERQAFVGTEKGIYFIKTEAVEKGETLTAMREGLFF